MPPGTEKDGRIKELGVKGYPMLIRNVPYINLWDSVVLPVGHTILLGLMKDFLKILFRKDTNDQIPFNNNIHMTT